MLMGSFPERVLEVNDAWKKGLADNLILVEEYMGPFMQLKSHGINVLSICDQAVASLISLGVPADSIIVLPGSARSKDSQKHQEKRNFQWIHASKFIHYGQYLSQYSNKRYSKKDNQIFDQNLI